jgi:diadenosine tetraphosphate (Ap4A) HIT family hydrolase
MNTNECLYHALCPCGCFDTFQDQEVDFIREFDHWFLALNWEQGFLGRSLLILKKHKTDEAELTDKESLEKHRLYKLWKSAVTKAFSPDKINQAQLGNEEYLHKGHIHWHFVPRYRRPMHLFGVEFQSDNAESQKICYSLVHKRIVYPVEIRQKIKEAIAKNL